MSDDLAVVAATVRAYLPVLLDETEAGRLDSRLAALLAGPGPRIDDLIEALATHARIHSLAAAIIADPEHRPPVAREVRPAGDGEIIDVEKFVCIAGDYIWYRLHVGEVVPACPTHGPLRPAGQQP